MIRYYNQEIKTNYSDVHVPMELLKQLRKETRAGIKDCRDALAASNNDMNEAKKWLEKQHSVVASKKMDRMAKEGGVLATVLNNKGVIFELNCETDFAGKEITFLTLMRKIFSSVEKAKLNELNEESILNLVTDTGKTVKEEITQLSYLLKEKVILSRFKVLNLNSNNRVHSYIHRKIEGDQGTPKIGRIGVIFEYSVDKKKVSPEEEKQINTFVSHITKHIAGYGPKTISKQENPEVPTHQVLLEQSYIMDESKTVAKSIEDFKNKTGITVTPVNFVRYNLGE